MKIALDKINPPKFNSRVLKLSKDGAKEDAEKLASLAASLKADGQQSPVEVMGPADDGTYELVFGDRRRRAAISLGWTEIDANISPPGSDAVRRNIIENMVREDLTVYEMARSIAELRKTETIKRTAEIVGKHQSYVSKLDNSYKHLAPQILADWERNHPAAETEVLYQLCDKDKYKTPEKQVEAWDQICRDYAKKQETKADKAKGGKEEKGGSSGFTLSQPAVKLVLAVVKSKKTPDKLNDGSKKWARDLVDYMLGQRKTPPDGIVDTEGAE